MKDVIIVFERHFVERGIHDHRRLTRMEGMACGME
jgi:hypothetical protein